MHLRWVEGYIKGRTDGSLEPSWMAERMDGYGPVRQSFSQQTM